MINIKEFRLGNYHLYHVTDTYEGDYDIISQIDEHDYLHLICNPDDDNYKPVPITEEILERLGFEKWQDNVYVLHNVIDGTSDFEVTLENGRVYFSIDENCCCWRKDLYLHDLQNILFEKTGMELELINS